MFRTILVALDSSDAAQAALRHATELAQASSGRVILLNVIDLSKLLAVAGYQTPYPVDTVQILRDEGRRVLDDSKSICEVASVPVTTIVTEGDACDEILRVAETNGVDLIALGTHGRGGLPRLFLGSVAEGVLRRATVPVLIVRS
jgi:nucleotide-binding universal stress UspA family protein